MAQTRQGASSALDRQPKSSGASVPLRFHLTTARSEVGAGGPTAPQSGHSTRNVPLCTIWARSPQNGQGFSTAMIADLSIFSSVADLVSGCRSMAAPISASRPASVRNCGPAPPPARSATGSSRDNLLSRVNAGPGRAMTPRVSYQVPRKPGVDGLAVCASVEA
jgi:hypothetical protein